MRILSAIVLLLWTICYGCCLAEQCGELSNEQTCCSGECEQVPDKAPMPPCEVCEFIQSGGVQPSAPLILDAPVFFCLSVFQIDNFAWETVVKEAEEGVRLAVDTGPPPLGRLCEWRASTATPVRGPTVGA